MHALAAPCRDGASNFRQVSSGAVNWNQKEAAGEARKSNRAAGNQVPEKVLCTAED